MKIGIIGNGFVGKATYQLKCKDIEVIAYDIQPRLCDPIGLTIHDLMACEVIFISVPTPMYTDGSCYTGIIERVLQDLKDYTGFIVLRSTVPVGTSDRLGCYFMPEFLTEKNYIQDFIRNKDWIFGGQDDEFQQTMTTLFHLAKKNGCIEHDTLHFLTNKEAEMVKMFRNCFLATKVSFCNEIYDFCQKKGIDYSNVVNIAAKDDRITTSHTMVPGHDGKRGFGGTCFPKDISSLQYEMEQVMNCHVISAAITRNNTVDRVEKDWLLDKGRASV
jgi:UDPglucose 6-dehydrogenase